MKTAAAIAPNLPAPALGSQEGPNLPSAGEWATHQDLSWYEEDMQGYLGELDQEFQLDGRSHQDAIGELERCYHMKTRWEMKLMEAICRIEKLKTHEQMGYQAVEEFVCVHFGMGFRRACELVRVALAVSELPALKAALQQGKLSYDHLRALSEIADEENQVELAEKAAGSSVAETFRMVRNHKLLTTEDSVDARSKRWLEKRWDQDLRMLHVHAQLPEDQGAVFEAALDSIAEKMPEDPLYDLGPTPMGMKRADALCELALGHLASGSSATSQVVVHLDADALISGQGNARIQGGPQVCVETVRRLMCDSSLQAVTENSDGKPIGFGRARRTAPPKMKRELLARDRGCKWPACHRTKLVEAHHIEEWAADSGKTDFDRMLIFCPYHHWLVHEGGYKVVGMPPKIEIIPPPSPYTELPSIKVGPPPISNEVKREFEKELARARAPDDP